MYVAYLMFTAKQNFSDIIGSSAISSIVCTYYEGIFTKKIKER